MKTPDIGYIISTTAQKYSQLAWASLLWTIVVLVYGQLLSNNFCKVQLWHPSVTKSCCGNILTLKQTGRDTDELRHRESLILKCYVALHMDNIVILY